MKWCARRAATSASFPRPRLGTHVTIPAHKNLTIGTLNGILTDVAAYLQMSRSELQQELFG